MVCRLLFIVFAEIFFTNKIAKRSFKGKYYPCVYSTIFLRRLSITYNKRRNLRFVAAPFCNKGYKAKCYKCYRVMAVAKIVLPSQIISMIKKYWVPVHVKISAAIFFVICSIMAQAQDSSRQLVLADAIKMAMDQNRQIGLAKKDEQIAQSQFKQTEAIFLPQVNFSYSGFTTNQPLSAFGFKLQQAQVQQADFNPTILNKPGATNNVLTQLSVQQPLYNPDLAYMRKAAAKQTAMYAFTTQRTAEAITLQVTNAYLQLEFSYEVVGVLEDALKTVKDIYRFTNDRYEQGLLQKSDVLNVAVQVKAAETSLAEAKSQVVTLSDQLGLLMNAPKGLVYKTVPVAMDSIVAVTDSVPVDRADFKAMKTAVEAFDLSIKSTKMSMLPKINGFANYQFNDKKLFGFGANAYMAGLQLSWDIFKGNQAKNKMATQVLEKNKLQQQLQDNMEQTATEIRKVNRQIADNIYRITQQSLAVESASEALRIVQNRYTQGLINTTDVLQSQTQLSQQKMAYAQAVFMKKSAISYLHFLTTTK
jgi:outer membrane protein TolC